MSEHTDLPTRPGHTGMPQAAVDAALSALPGVERATVVTAVYAAAPHIRGPLLTRADRAEHQARVSEQNAYSDVAAAVRGGYPFYAHPEVHGFRERLLHDLGRLTGPLVGSVHPNPDMPDVACSSCSQHRTVTKTRSLLANAVSWMDRYRMAWMSARRGRAQARQALATVRAQLAEMPHMDTCEDGRCSCPSTRVTRAGDRPGHPCHCVDMLLTLGSQGTRVTAAAQQPAQVPPGHVALVLEDDTVVATAPVAVPASRRPSAVAGWLAAFGGGSSHPATLTGALPLVVAELDARLRAQEARPDCTAPR
jgi:hypothetical protein